MTGLLFHRCWHIHSCL